MFIDIHIHIAQISDIGWTKDADGPASPEQFIAILKSCGFVDKSQDLS